MRICLFLGSKLGINAKYSEVARELGQCLASRKIGIVYGGASIGLMGELARSAFNAGGEVIGVIPHNIAEVEIPPTEVSQLIHTKTLAKREKIMFELSDGFIALPGGIGTLEEIFTVLAWNALRYHDKPVGLLNSCGYYDKFIEMMQFQCDEGFISPTWTDQFVISSAVDDLVLELTEKI